jgi:Cellulose binding domain
VRNAVLTAVLLVALGVIGGVMVMLSSTPARPRPAHRAPVAVHKVVAPAPIAVHIGYRTADRSFGYYEEVLTIRNRTGAALHGWTVSFDVPGADVHSVWGAALRRTGPAPVIAGTTTIPAGGSAEVRFGATGAPATPRACTLNGRPCTFGS